MTINEWKHSQTDRDMIRLAALANTENVILKDEAYQLTVTKPQLVIVAEQTYRATFAMLYGPESELYKTVSREQVAIDFAAGCAVNPSLMAASYPMERCFDTMMEWWMANNQGQTDFHPYPWDVTSKTFDLTRKVIDRVEPSIAEVNGWGRVTPQMIEDAR